MLLSSSLFSGFLSVVSSVVPVVIGLIILLFSTNYILKMLSRILNAPDSVSDFAQKTIRENDSIMADLKRKERERSGK